MILAADIGNTNIHFGVFDNTELLTAFEISSTTVRSSDEYFIFILASLESASASIKKKIIISDAIISSVLPSVTIPLKKALERITGTRVDTVGPGVKTGFRIKLDNPTELGADIACNAAAVIDRFSSPAIFVDFGSATVISAIDNELSLAAVSIMPGIQMGLDALSSTGLLPGIFSDKSLPIIPKNTSDSMRCGIIRGTALAVKGLADHFKKNLSISPSAPLVVGGGFSELIIPFLPRHTMFIPNMTLVGLNVIYRINTSVKQR